MALKKYKLSDVAKVEISSVDKKTKEDEVPVRLCNFTDVYYNWAITKETADLFMKASANASEIEKFTIKKGQVALTKDSETRYDIGISTYIADDLDGVILGYHCALITPDESKVNGKYLNAFMHSAYIQKYFENCASGSGQRYTLSLETLESMPLLLPSLEEQQAIGNVFSSVDRKILLNRAINQNLEALAKQLYDYWFVQFDFPDENGKPYKSSGGTMVWNEKLKMELPPDWHNSTLGDICTMYQPQTIGTDMLLSDGKYRVYGANGVVGRYNKYNHENSEIAMACRGNSCGTLNRTMPYSWITGNAMVIKLKNQSISNEYIKQALAYMNIAGAVSGSGQPQLTRENLNTVSCIRPSDSLLIAYSQKIAPIVNYQLHLIEDIDKLVKLRDELLPLLMNGQVSLNSYLS